MYKTFERKFINMQKVKVAQKICKYLDNFRVGTKVKHYSATIYSCILNEPLYESQFNSCKNQC